MEETAYLLRSPANAQQLLEPIAELEVGKGVARKINRMNPIFPSQVWEDYLYWQKTDKLIANRIHALIKVIQQNLFEGIGKPGPLKHRLSSYGSRCINDEHRIVYKIINDDLFIAQLRYHY